MLQKKRIYLIGYVCTLTLLATAFLFSPGLITIFTVESSGFETIDLPNVQDGTEIESQGYKYANTSGVIVTTEPVVSCTWKPDNEDDGWVTCEAIFEVENLADNKPLLTAPEIIFDFQDNKSIRNIEISYASAYEVEDEIIVEETTEEIEQTINVESLSEPIPENGQNTEEAIFPGITGRAIADARQEDIPQTTEEINRTATIIKPEKKFVQKRRFTSFKPIPQATERIIQQNSTNQTTQNVTTQDTPQNITNQENNTTTQNTQQDQQTNITTQNFPSSDNNNATENSPLPGTNTTTTNEQNATSSQNTNQTEQDSQNTDDLSSSNSTESNQNSSQEQEPETSEDATQEPITVDQNDSVTTEDQPQTDTKETPTEEPISESQEPDSSESEEPITEEPSTDESNGADAEENTLQEPEEEPEQTNPLQGLAIRLIGYSVFQDVAIDTRNPFAIRIQFETPKYATNQFNFELKENQFQAMIDPDVSACGTLNTENGVYTLTQNVTATGTCFTISANNVTVDCQGNLINHSTTTDNTYGIYSTANQTTIQNCHVTKGNTSATSSYSLYYLNTQGGAVINSSFTTNAIAMLLDTSTNITIENNTIKTVDGTSPYGIYLQSSSNNNFIKNNTINTSGSGDSIALYVTSSSNTNTLQDNTVDVKGLSGYGIFLDSASNTIVEHNVMNVIGSVGFGIFSESSQNSFVQNNTVNHSGTGGQIVSAQSTSVDEQYHNNNFFTSKNNVDGIYAQSNSRINATNNTIHTLGSQAYGVQFIQIANSYITGNNITTAGGDAHAVYLRQSNTNSVTNNRANTSGAEAYGIFLETTSRANMLHNNTIHTTGLGSDGIYLSTTTDNTNLAHNIIMTNDTDAKGIYLASSNNTFQDTQITITGPTSPGIYFRTDTKNNTFSNIDIITLGSGSHPIYIAPSEHFFTLYNGTLNATNANTADIHFGEQISTDVPGGEWNITNITFTDTNWSNAANGTLNVHWYLNIVTNHSNGSAIRNTNVTVWDAQDQFKFSALTNANGLTAPYVLQQYKQNSSTETIHFTNHTVNATLPDNSETVTTSVNLTTNTQATLTFGIVAESEGGGGSGGGSGGGGGGGSSGGSSGGNTNANNNPQAQNQAPSLPQQAQNNQNQRGRSVLFDINLEIIEKTVPSRGTLLGAIGLINLGVPGEVDATLLYEIRDNNGAVVYQETEVTQVQTQTQFIKNLQMPQLPEGDYTLFVDLTYVGQQEPAQAEDAFSVEGAITINPIPGNVLFTIIMTTIFTAIGFVGTLLYKTVKKRGIKPKAMYKQVMEE